MCLAHKELYSFGGLQYLLPAIVHINHQAFLERGDGPIVSTLILPSCVDLHFCTVLNSDFSCPVSGARTNS